MPRRISVRSLKSPRVKRSGTCFVAMPFDADFDDIYHYAIQPVVEERGLECVRIDREAFVGDIPHRIRELIRASTLVIADMSGANSNVYFETGFAQGANVPTILVCNRCSELWFDVRGERCLFYDRIVDLEESLSGELDKLLSAVVA
jgi:hypothetical protein